MPVFATLQRSYQYRICNRAVRPALQRHYLAWQRRPLDVEQMQSAAQVLLGKHDFSSFRASGCQAKSPIRDIQQIKLARNGDIVTLDITADGFLYHMVRNVVGSLMRVGYGEREPHWLAEVLQQRDRCAAGKTAPSCGLYFVGARYPDKFKLPTITNQ